MGIPDIPLFLLLLVLPFLVEGGVPSFLNEDDYKQCDDQSCWWTTFDIELGETDVKVPNTKIIARTDDWDWIEVTLTSLLEECSPSLAPSQLAYSFTDCQDMTHDIEETCGYVKRGWLDDQGKIAAAFLETTFSGLEHASGYIGECLAWDGDRDDYYDYYGDYNYNDYDYDYLEESGADDKRVKRDTSITSGETALRTGRTEREAERTSNHLNVVRKKKKGKGVRKGGRKAHRRGKNKQNNGGKKESKNNGHKTEKSGKSQTKKQKGHRKNHVKGKHNKRNGRKKDSKKNANKKAEKEKKKEQEKKKALKKIGLKSLPTKSVLAQLWCIDRAVDRALEKCGEKHLRGVDLTNATIV